MENSEITEADPAIVFTAYHTSIEDVIEHVTAADTLGLGFRLESYMVSDIDDPSSAHAEWAFTLLGEMPVRVEAAD